MGLYTSPQSLEQNSNGASLGGAKLYFYEVGTTTLKTVYTDKGLTVAHTNPVVADSAGRFDPIYTDGSYKIKLTDTDDTEIWTEDDVSFGASGDFFSEKESISTTTVIDATYEKKHLRCTGTISLNLLAVSSAGEGFMFSLRNDGTGIVTIDPNSSEQINDATTILLAPGDGGIVICDGSEWSYIGTEALKQGNKGSDIASANALTLGSDGNYFDVTGTTAITSISTTGKIGTIIKLHFDGILTLTHHTTDLILPRSSNITTAAGDEAEFIEYADGDWRCTSYVRADGSSVAGDSIPNAGGYRTDYYYFGAGFAANASNFTVTADRIYLKPFMVSEIEIFTRIGVYVSTLSAGNGRLGIYNAVNGVPTSLVLDAGTISTGTTGEKEVTISQSLEAGVYFLAIVFDATPDIVYCSADEKMVNHLLGNDTYSGSGGSVYGFYDPFTYAALPDPVGGLTNIVDAATLPNIWLRKV